MIFQRMNRHVEMLKMLMDPTNIKNVQIKHIFSQILFNFEYSVKTIYGIYLIM